jgi:transposase-like protein
MERRERYPLEARKEIVVAALAGGASAGALARKYKVTVSAVTAFARKHAVEIDGLRARVAERVADVAVAEMEARIRVRAEVVNRLHELMREGGLRVRTRGGVRVDDKLVRALNETLDGIAREKGEYGGDGGQGDSVHFTKVDVYVGARPETPSTDQEGPVIVDG